VPVIFMTGWRDRTLLFARPGSGGVDYVTKPIVIEEMLAGFGVHLANARLTPERPCGARTCPRRYLLAVNRQGKIMWATPQAQKLCVG